MGAFTVEWSGRPSWRRCGLNNLDEKEPAGSRGVSLPGHSGSQNQAGRGRGGLRVGPGARGRQGGRVAAAEVGEKVRGADREVGQVRPGRQSRAGQGAGRAQAGPSGKWEPCQSL